MFKHKSTFFLGCGVVLLSIFCYCVLESVYAQDKKFSYTIQGRRDPFVPLISPAGYLLNLQEEESSVLRLEGIMYDPQGDSMVIINGELIKAGERVADVLVTEIQPDKIVVLKDNQKTEIELRREE